MVALRPAPHSSERALDHGIPVLISQLVDTLRAEESTNPEAEYAAVPDRITTAARKHGGMLLREGYTLDQVVHDYGDLCQAITELAHDIRVPITVEEFHTFNRCLDSAIAEAVGEFGRLHDLRVAETSARTHNDRLVLLATELRTSVNAAMLAFNAIKTGRVAVSGQTGLVLDRSLMRLSDVIERTLAEVRLDTRRQVTRETIELPTFFEHLSVFAVLEAAAKAVGFKISAEAGIVVEADRELLSSAVAILLQNALRFTPAGGHVILRARVTSDRILVEVEDECGGLAPAVDTELRRVIASHTEDGSGVAICRHAVQLTGGTLGLKHLPHRGCIFTIDLPKIS
ncbi:MAG: HAMP domain-containing sensor histidine kinase [Kofleriaceae bacterium]